jgi:hypothetical protein
MHALGFDPPDVFFTVVPIPDERGDAVFNFFFEIDGDECSHV